MVNPGRWAAVLLLACPLLTAQATTVVGAHLAPVPDHSGSGKALFYAVPGGLLIEASMSELPEEPCRLVLLSASGETHAPPNEQEVIGTFLVNENGTGYLGLVHPNLLIKNILWKNLAVICGETILARGRIQPPDQK